MLQENQEIPALLQSAEVHRSQIGKTERTQSDHLFSTNARNGAQIPLPGGGSHSLKAAKADEMKLVRFFSTCRPPAGLLLQGAWAKRVRPGHALAAD
jgi:hypothetical protein